MSQHEECESSQPGFGMRRQTYLKLRWIILCVLAGLVCLTITSWRRHRSMMKTQDLHVKTNALTAPRTNVAEDVVVIADADLPADKKLRPMSTIMYMEGWMTYENFYNGVFTVYLDYYSVGACGYSCISSRTGETRYSAADVIVFQPSVLNQEAPRKYSHQYWILHSFEPLKSHEIRNFHKYGYDNLIDHFLIRPETVLTPLVFMNRLNTLQGDLETDVKLMRYHNRHPPLTVAQITAFCATPLPSAEELEQTLTLTLSHRLKELSPEVKLSHIVMCYEWLPSMLLPSDVTFVVLDVKACHVSLFEQFLTVLRNEQSDAIPIIPHLSRSEDLEQLVSVAPPTSFISAADYKDTESLLRHLENVVVNSRLFSSYHNWRGTYTLATEAGADPVKSAICKFCQLGHQRPPSNIDVLVEPCK